MENKGWNQRLAAVRRAAGLTQEQLGELVGVTRQAVSKWESGQAVPDAMIIAAICRALHVSADYILLDREPEEDEAAETPSQVPDTCPCCGRGTSGGICPVCGYTPLAAAPAGPRYAVTGALAGPIRQDQAQRIVKYCGLTHEEIDRINEGYQCTYPHNQIVFCRGRDAWAAQWIASHLNQGDLMSRIIEDKGEEEDLLRVKPDAMAVPPLEQLRPGGLGFWGTVGAVAVGVILTLILLSFF